VRIADLAPGEETQFDITISNREKVGRFYTLICHSPSASERRGGRDRFPDHRWVCFSQTSLEVAAESQRKVRVLLAVPNDPRWAGRDWEFWIGVVPETNDLLNVKLYVRVLVSTRGRPAGWLVASLAVVAVAAVLVVVSVGLYRRSRAPRRR